MWQPILIREFEEMLNEQKSQLDGEAKFALAEFQVPIHTAILRRTSTSGDENVFVVASTNDGVLYFDDVENGFNFSPLDKDGRVREPGGSQMNLADALHTWLVPKVGRGP